ncbi:legumain-like isoform X3 [Adelges cooleyi]|uniref:legumain-like isoform X2 n=1 Tax=Adelges cooleyi TaxID=133065 RepID=UPI00217FF7D7|nr:legumain-like isoform X2 [Adelges cooleyi]XP_050426911.1 legumain-like isoform X3 [Adelges cooleyi]
MGALGFVKVALLLMLVIGSYGYADENSKSGEKFVLLVAGSYGWHNYRHQADVAHAYQIVRGNGIPAENIIVMMYDDVANHTSNPARGTLINHPGGSDVYHGVKVDYQGYDIKSSVLLSVLKGNKSGVKGVGSGRVIESGPRDNIFVYYTDHGGPGIVGLPNGVLYADHLINTLNEMYIRRKYNKMLLYVEACESGSMFDGLLAEDQSILAVTASGPRESSWGCFCGEESGPYNTCLGDLFSVTFMEDLDNHINNEENASRSIFNQYQTVRTAVDMSNVMVYGDFHVGFDKLSSFIGLPANKSSAKYSPKTYQSRSVMSSRDIYEKSLSAEISSTTDLIKQKLLEGELHLYSKTKTFIDYVLQTIYTKLVSEMPKLAAKIGEYENIVPMQLTMNAFPCYRNIVDTISEKCFSITENSYALGKLSFLANICIVDNSLDKKLLQFVDNICI